MIVIDAANINYHTTLEGEPDIALDFSDSSDSDTVATLGDSNNE